MDFLELLDPDPIHLRADPLMVKANYSRNVSIFGHCESFSCLNTVGTFWDRQVHDKDMNRTRTNCP